MNEHHGCDVGTLLNHLVSLLTRPYKSDTLEKSEQTCLLQKRNNSTFIGLHDSVQLLDSFQGTYVHSGVRLNFLLFFKHPVLMSMALPMVLVSAGQLWFPFLFNRKFVPFLLQK